MLRLSLRAAVAVAAVILVPAVWPRSAPAETSTVTPAATQAAAKAALFDHTAGPIPGTSAEVPFFYYNNLPAAKDWYAHKLGLKMVADHGWFAVFKVAPHSYLGLIDANSGTLKPTVQKGALLSISTNHLDAWYKRLQAVPGLVFETQLHVAARGLVDEFSVRDPEGYLIEFFHWRSGPGAPPNPFVQ